jgi:hypothetical protein
VENYTEGRITGRSRELDFTPWGGAYNRVPTRATAFAHREELFLLLHVVVVDPDVPAAERQAGRAGLGSRGRPCIRGDQGRLPELPRSGPR